MNDIIGVIGESAAYALAAAFGGCTLYIPKSMSSNIGVKRNDEIKTMYRQGEKLNEIAKAYNLSTRQILNILSK